MRGRRAPPKIKKGRGLARPFSSTLVNNYLPVPNVIIPLQDAPPFAIVQLRPYAIHVVVNAAVE